MPLPIGLVAECPDCFNSCPNTVVILGGSTSPLGSQISKQSSKLRDAKQNISECNTEY